MNLTEFQKRWGKYGLKETGELDVTTLGLLSRRFCACSDYAEMGTGLRRWSGDSITWVDNGVRVGRLSFTAAMRYTTEQISSACGLRIEILTAARSANVVAHSWRGDGPNGTLARAWLPGSPSGPNDSRNQQYDVNEGHLSQRLFDDVVLHETCHSLGLEHDTGPEIALMDPFLNPAIRGLQPADKSQLVERYGPPSDGDSDEPEPSATILLVDSLIDTLEDVREKLTS